MNRYEKCKKDFQDVLNDVPDDLAEVFVYKACEHDFELFLSFCCDSFFWGEPGISHYDFIDDANKIAASTIKNESGTFQRKPALKINNISHRGSAKTTLAIAFVVWQIVYNRERYIVYGSNDDGKAKESLKNIRDLLQSPLITKMYAPVFTASNTEQLIVNDICIHSRSIKQNWRGINYKKVRPTLILLDDIQSEEMAHSPAERETTWKTFTDSIIPCPPLGNYPIQGVIILINTALHPESIAVKTKDRLDFTTRIYPAIVKEPTNESLWRVYDSIYTDRITYNDNNDALEAAESFYQSNKERMDEGVLINWSGGTSYNELRRIRISNGITTFNREYQGNPVDVTKLVFSPYLLTHNNELRKDVLFAVENHMIKLGDKEFDLTALPKWGYFDGAEGKSSQGCFAALTVMAHKQTPSESVGQSVIVTGLDFVIDSLLMKEPAEQQAEKLIMKAYEWNLRALVIESSTFQGMYASLLKLKGKELIQQGRIPEGWDLKVIPMTPIAQQTGVGKEAYIESIIISLGLGVGTLKFNENLNKEFWTQLTQFPTGSFVDAPDSLAGALYFYYRFKSSVQEKAFERKVINS